MPLHFPDVQGPRYFLRAEAYRTLKRHKCRAPPAFTETLQLHRNGPNSNKVYKKGNRFWKRPVTHPKVTWANLGRLPELAGIRICLSCAPEWRPPYTLPGQP